MMIGFSTQTFLEQVGYVFEYSFYLFRLDDDCFLETFWTFEIFFFEKFNAGGEGVIIVASELNVFCF